MFSMPGLMLAVLFFSARAHRSSPRPPQVMTIEQLAFVHTAFEWVAIFIGVRLYMRAGEAPRSRRSARRGSSR